MNRIRAALVACIVAFGVAATHAIALGHLHNSAAAPALDHDAQGCRLCAAIGAKTSQPVALPQAPSVASGVDLAVEPPASLPLQTPPPLDTAAPRAPPRLLPA